MSAERVAERLLVEILRTLIELFGHAIVKQTVDEWDVADARVRAEWRRRFPGEEPP